MIDNVIKAVLISFGISVVMCPVMIPFLRKLKCGQYIREEGPKEHLKKCGTPTMGGLVILCGIVITSIMYMEYYPRIVPILFMTLGFGLIGFLDDFIKMVTKKSMGLTPIQKMMLQIIITTIFVLYLSKNGDNSTVIPFTNGKKIDIGHLYIPLVYVVVIGTANGANFTDGLDGLVSGVTIMIAVFFTVVGYVTESGTEPVSAAVTGGLLGFVLYNSYPARIFMGDTGSLALGGFVASTAYMLDMPLILLMVAFIYVIEVLSVIIQVTYYKCTNGKRIFKMSPIHHHLEMCGWSETRIVTLFSTITALLCMLAYLAI